ncbi:cell wall-active antibiotics response protein LiaF [Evansella sp. AB-rgal1]|uniref:cell wall-active antibiotics response protein LiaF n=1 Tax=Evansella sp. AB-rgal1 TaxID=3242696 RepID=UPI00359DDD48
MLRRLSTDTINMILLIGIALLFIELFFFNSGLVFTLVFFSLLLYFGLKKYDSTFGKILFWIGVVVLFFTVLNMMAVKFLIIAAIVLFFVQYNKSKKEPEHVEPHIEAHNTTTEEPLVKVKPLFYGKFFGTQKTDEAPYQWRDINIHGGFGDRVIDLSNTVLPDDSVISIRHFIGNIKIYVPYEVEVTVLHSSVFGRATIFHNQHASLLNQTMTYRTENYDSTTPRVKIVTSVLSGDIEVKRI